MNTRAVPKKKIVATAMFPFAFLAVTPGSCGTTSTTSSDSATVVVTASDDVCWSGTVDDRPVSGCGTASYTSNGSTHRAKVTKNRGHHGLTVSLVSNGKTVDESTVQSSNQYVTVHQG
jgi:hypothetical protein